MAAGPLSPLTEPLAFHTSRKQTTAKTTHLQQVVQPWAASFPSRGGAVGGAFPLSSLSPSYDSVLGLCFFL